MTFSLEYQHAPQHKHAAKHIAIVYQMIYIAKKNMARRGLNAKIGKVLTVGEMIQALKEFDTSLPLKLLNWDDKKLESREIADVFYFEGLDTQDGYKSDHVVISYQKDE